MSLLDQEYYSSEELAEMLGITTRTIRNYLKNGKIKGYKIGGKWRFSKNNIEEFIRNQRNELLNIEDLAKKGMDTCKLILNFQIDFEKQTEFFQVITETFNNYEKNHEKNINSHLSCLHLNDKVVEVLIAGESQHVLNLASIIINYKNSNSHFSI